MAVPLVKNFFQRVPHAMLSLLFRRDGIQCENQLLATAVWLKPIGASNNLPATIILDDKGKAASAVNMADRLNRGEQVLAVDLPFVGEACAATVSKCTLSETLLPHAPAAYNQDRISKSVARASSGKGK